MIALSVLLLFVLSVYSQAPCDECAGDGCKVLDTVKVNKLCADELCVDGSSVVVGDGNPCTSDDVVDGVQVHLPIQNCCSTVSDCARWAPAPNCVAAECIFTEELTTHGWCQFTDVPDCCAEAKDCPEKACKTAVCRPNSPGDVILSHQRKRFVELAPHQLENNPGRCVYTDDENCCLTTRDCAGKCRPGEFGICDKGMVCQCVPPNANECSKDEDCAADEAAKRTCEEGCEDETKPPCYYYECDRGWCTCVFDPDRDFDGDGVCCKDDCDDRNPDAQEKILCPVGTLEEINADGDDFYKCLIKVEPTCDPTCPNEAEPVSIEQTQEINGERVLVFDCDCCDNNPAGLDQPLTCAKDANELNGNAPSSDCEPAAPFTCNQCYESLCVLQGESGKVPIDDIAALDMLCEEALGEDYSFFPVPAEPSTEPCDFCDDVADATSLTPTLMCPTEYNRTVNDVERTYSICPLVDGGQEFTPALLEACCEYVLDLADNEPTAPIDLADYKACCQSLKQLEPPYSAACGQCGITAPTNSEFPGTCSRCECNNEWPSPCNFENPSSGDQVVACVIDKDGDKYYDCADIKRVCVPRDNPLSEIETCINLFGENATSLNDARQGNFDTFDGTFCDCDDTIPGVFQLIVCGEDGDGDGNLKCEGSLCADGAYMPRPPVCTAVCATRCGEPFVRITTDNCEPVEQAPVRRRNAIANVMKVAESHGWFNADENQDASRKRAVVHQVAPRVDETCSERLCNKCDCCDEDSSVFHGSSFATAAENQCGHYDMNCDCMYHSTVACPDAVSDADNENYYLFTEQPLISVPTDAVDFSVGIRNLGSATAAKYLTDSVYTATPDRLGYCGDDCDNMCMDFIPGISAESKFGGPGNRKRALTIELQKSCTKLVSINETNLDANNNVLTLLPGECFEFIEACGKPCDTKGNCNADCEICTKLWN